jgi:two-component system, cell cycle response regulator DivK
VYEENRATAPPTPRILVAEDHSDSRDALQALLESQGYEVWAAVNGEDAVHRAENQAPDLILMDIMMPVMDGLDATRRLRDQPAFDAVPIVALSAMEGGRESAMQAGCDDFLPKPIDLRTLFQKVHWWVEHRRDGFRTAGA